MHLYLTHTISLCVPPCRHQRTLYFMSWLLPSSSFWLWYSTKESLTGLRCGPIHLWSQPSSSKAASFCTHSLQNRHSILKYKSWCRCIALWKQVYVPNFWGWCSQMLEQQLRLSGSQLAACMCCGGFCQESSLDDSWLWSTLPPRDNSKDGVWERSYTMHYNASTCCSRWKW